MFFVTQTELNDQMAKLKHDIIHAEELVREALSGSTSEVGGLVNIAFCDLSYFLCPTLGNLCYRRKA